MLLADLNHDGIPDRIEVSIAPDEEGKSAAELVDGLSLGFIKVFAGKPDGGFEEDPGFVSRGVNGAHVANGTLMLVRRDGQDYLLYCSFYGIMGEADYAYTVFWLQDGMGVTVEDRRFASFALPGGEPANLPGRDEVLLPTGRRWRTGRRRQSCCSARMRSWVRRRQRGRARRTPRIF